MKLTETQLKRIIAEELQLMVERGELDEGWFDRLAAGTKGALSSIGGAAKGTARAAAGSALKGASGAVDAAVGDGKESGSQLGNRFAKQGAKDLKQAKNQFDSTASSALKQRHAAKLTKLHANLKAQFEDLAGDAEKMGLDKVSLGNINKSLQALASAIASLNSTKGKSI